MESRSLELAKIISKFETSKTTGAPFYHLPEEPHIVIFSSSSSIKLYQPLSKMEFEGLDVLAGVKYIYKENLGMKNFLSNLLIFGKMFNFRCGISSCNNRNDKNAAFLDQNERKTEPYFA